MPLSKIDSDSLTAPLTVPAGSAAAPAITTTGDTNTGIFFPAADTIGFSEGGAEAMRIISTGDVGIGTSSPAARLDITEAVTSTIGNSLGLNIQNNDSRNVGELFQIGMGNTSGNKPMTVIGTVVNTSSFFGNGDIFFATRSVTTDTAPTERARINSSGVLMVNTTDQDAQINTTPTTNQFTFRPDDGIRCSITGTNFFTRSGDGTIFNFRRNATTVGTISVSTGATAYNTSSDYRLKNTIAPMTGALAKVALLKPVTYKWNVDGSNGQGFIAHELDEVVPGCVTGEKDAVDADGNPVHQGIDTSFLVATLTAAIQEQQALITALTTRITALEAA